MRVEIKQNIVVVRVIHVKLEWIDTDDGPILLVPFLDLLTKFATFAIHEDFVVCFIPSGNGGQFRSRKFCQGMQSDPVDTAEDIVG